MQTSVLATTPAPISLDSYIVSTPDILRGRPRIAGHRIGVVHIKGWRLRAGMSFEQIAETYDLSIAAVYAAMAYYYAHKAEIDQREAEDEAFAEEMRAQMPSKLKAKLAALSV